MTDTQRQRAMKAARELQKFGWLGMNLSYKELGTVADLIESSCMQEETDGWIRVDGGATVKIKNYVLENGQEVTGFGDDAGAFEEAIFDLFMSNDSVTLKSEQKDDALYVRCL